MTTTHDSPDIAEQAPATTKQRVRAWLNSHEEWCAAKSSRSNLAVIWDAVAQVYGAESAPARGCLLALVREAWGDDGLTTYRRDDGWRVARSGPNGHRYQAAAYSSEAVALRDALEDAPV